jgi:hypothetical protein
MVIIQHFASTGLPRHRTAINHLENGIWEFKHGVKRASFYDVEASGDFDPKLPNASAADCDRGVNAEYWWVPSFSRQIRTGYFFAKDGPMAGSENIQKCIQIRKEDLAYDRAA